MGLAQPPTAPRVTHRDDTNGGSGTGLAKDIEDAKRSKVDFTEKTANLDRVVAEATKEITAQWGYFTAVLTTPYGKTRTGGVTTAIKTSYPGTR
ncbi:hypothetical protein [Kitasatospora sp. NPDC098663]|uniref:hypothetical protein n=1 Tax=Kitasatospora sp. NPDC098663 TaxID=3364096 RepID=UPI0037FE1FD5